MSLDIADPGRSVFYINFRTEGTGENFCVGEQNFNFANLIDDASRYCISVERFRVPCQGIPMLPQIDSAVRLIPKMGAPGVNYDLLPCFSLQNFLLQLNSVATELRVSINPDGRVNVTFTNFNNYSIQFHPKIAAIFAMDNTLDAIGTQTFIGAASIFDRYDDLHKLQIEALTGLSSVVQEIISTNIYRNLLTDFLVPTSVSMTFEGGQNVAPTTTYTITTPMREDIEFNNASNRRFIMLRGNAPIQNIALEVFAVFRDGTRHRILMPPNSVFECKLAMWKKN